MSWREGLLLSLVFHVLFFSFLVFTPSLFEVSEEAIRQREAAMEQQKTDEPMRFVFVQPRVDAPAPRPPEQAEPSDLDRQSRSPEPRLENPLPSSRGNTRERVERSQNEVARGRGPTPDPAAGQRAQVEQPPAPPAPDSQIRLPESQSALQIPTPQPQAQPGTQGRAPNQGGSLGDALRNLQRYVQRDNFDNSQGGGAFGPAIQFDTKGVEFGPWIRRFIAQVKRNWLIPYAAMSMRGRVIVTFNVHKDGTITDLSVVNPSPIDAFNNAAFGALASSNPTAPLPPEYPADRAFFTVTFFYNEEPQ